MKIIKHLLICILTIISAHIYAQNEVSIGNWRTHLPYHNVKDVEIFGDNYYAATPYELFYYDSEDESISILNKIKGLSDVGINKIRYNETIDALLVAYNNTNIDLIKHNGDIINLKDIKDHNIIGAKTINNVCFDGSTAYIACSFGIVVYNLERTEVKDTYYIGNNGSYVNINDIAIYNDSIYAATENGIFKASLNENSLANFAVWHLDQSLFYPQLNYNEIETFGGKLYANYSTTEYSKDTMFVYDGNHWDYFMPSSTSNVREIRNCGEKMTVSRYYSVHVFNTEGDEEKIIYQLTNNDDIKNITPSSATMDSDGKTFWIGDTKRGALLTRNGWTSTDILPNCPHSKNVYEITTCGDNVSVATGGHSSTWANTYLKDGVSRFDGSWWVNYYPGKETTWSGIYDPVCSVIDPYDETVTYIGTWGLGVLKMKDGKIVETYNANNSSLGGLPSNADNVRISGLAFDQNGNLWVANSSTTNMLSVMKRDGTWKSFYLGSNNSNTDIANLMIDANGYKWILKRNNGDGRVIVFNDNGTIDVTNDDQVRLLYNTAGNGGLNGSQAFSMATDLNGAVWIGTDSGPSVFYDTRTIFTSSSITASQILIDRNDGTGQADPLFDNIKVLSIAVDGANQKWFGLETGVYQMSADCKTVLTNFNTENSPLLSNEVNTMAISKSGEIFFGTNEGIISFRGHAAEGSNENEEVKVYPNPVRADFDGYVGITGLANNALVRITTVDGMFVTQLRAKGSQATWDLTNISGVPVKPGIYVVFSSLDDGKQKYSTKILVMKNGQ